MAQAVERRIGSAEVTGPIPVGSFKVQAYACTFFCIDFHVTYVQGIVITWKNKYDKECTYCLLKQK